MKKNILMRSFFVLSATALSAFGIYSLVNKVSTAQAATPCIVTIFGVQYDVAPLKTGHSGGDVFICNTDMTTVYQGMHGTNVSRMVGFIVATPTPSVTPGPSTSPTPSPSVSPKPSVSPTPSSSPVVKHHDDHDENEDEHEDRHDDDEKKEQSHKIKKSSDREKAESRIKSESRHDRDDD